MNRREFNQLLGAAALTQALPLSTTHEPPPPDDVCDLTATELASRIRRKQLSAREVMTAHLARIERVNPKVNAIVTLVGDRAMAAAAKADEAQAKGRTLSPLHGLPVAHKDLTATAGIRTTMGSPFFRDNVPTHDALIVTRMRAAGAITVGKTNTPEFGAGSHTFNTVFGATKNPYDVTKSCGGSSGGAAVALATGMVPIADGTDMGGSLRNPAAFCNVVGFRTSPGRVPTEPATWAPFSVAGPMARTVSDVALFLSVLAGYDSHSPLSISEGGSRFAAKLDANVKGKRVAWWRGLGGIPFEPEIRRVVDDQRKVFENLGCIVEDAEPDFSGVADAFPVLRHLGYFASYSALARQRPEWVKDTIKWEIAEAEKCTGADVARAQARQNRLFDESRQFFEKYDYFVLPVTQVAPFDVTIAYPTEIAGTPMRDYIDWMRSCWYVSFMSNPSISVPAGFTSTGLPVGIQIVGKHRDEWSILRMAFAFEQATRVGRVAKL